MSKLELFFFLESGGIGSQGNAWRVTDATLEQVANLQNCTFLDLEGADISDEGLRQLRTLRNLRYLDLRDTEISDGGLPHLICLTRLQQLILKRTRATNQAVDALQRALPQCQIER